MKIRVPKDFGGGRDNMMKKIQDMQAEMAAKQEELNNKEYTAESGGGAVSATVKGTRELVSLKLAPEAVDPDDIEMLSDLIIAAVNEAGSLAVKDSEQQLGSLTEGLNIPGLNGML